jgi:hypothetical protein
MCPGWGLRASAKIRTGAARRRAGVAAAWWCGWRISLRAGARETGGGLPVPEAGSSLASESVEKPGAGVPTLTGHAAPSSKAVRRGICTGSLLLGFGSWPRYGKGISRRPPGLPDRLDGAACWRPAVSARWRPRRRLPSHHRALPDSLVGASPSSLPTMRGGGGRSHRSLQRSECPVMRCHCRRSPGLLRGQLGGRTASKVSRGVCRPAVEPLSSGRSCLARPRRTRRGHEQASAAALQARLPPRRPVSEAPAGPGATPRLVS